MAFGRRTGKDGGKRKAGHAPVQPADEHVRPEDTVVASAAAASGVEDQEELQGPFDIDDFDDPSVAVLARLDLGSVLIPMPAAGQVQVELTESGVPSAVWVITPNGRYSIAAYAALRPAGSGVRWPANSPTRCARTRPKFRSRMARGVAK